MKKFFAVLAIAAAITACNNSGESDKTGKDSIQPDTSATKVDTTKKADTTAHKADTTAAKK